MCCDVKTRPSKSILLTICRQCAIILSFCEIFLLLHCGREIPSVVSPALTDCTHSASFHMKRGIRGGNTVFTDLIKVSVPQMKMHFRGKRRSVGKSSCACRGSEFESQHHTPIICNDSSKGFHTLF